MCLNIYELDLARFLTAPDLAWQAALKKSKVKSDLLTDIDILSMVGKRFTMGNGQWCKIFQEIILSGSKILLNLIKFS